MLQGAGMATEQHAHLQRCRRSCPGVSCSGCTMRSVHGCPGSPDTAPTGKLHLCVQTYRSQDCRLQDSFWPCIPYNL